jgi:HipA-like C-terminal domain
MTTGQTIARPEESGISPSLTSAPSRHGPAWIRIRRPTSFRWWSSCRRASWPPSPKSTSGDDAAELDYLLHSLDDRAGALGFGLGQQPPAPRRKFNQTLVLEKLQAIADAIISDKELPADPDMTQAEELLLAGTSMGGARPKAAVEDDNALWIAKLNRPDDRWNHARAEHAMLARACGLTTADSRIVTMGGRDVLMVKRFDREKAKAGYQRARMISALTLLGADESAQARDKCPTSGWSKSFAASASIPKRMLTSSSDACASTLLSPTPTIIRAIMRFSPKRVSEALARV